MDKYTKIGIDQMAMNRQRMKELEKTKAVAEYLLCKKKESTLKASSLNSLLFMKIMYHSMIMIKQCSMMLATMSLTLLDQNSCFQSM